MIELKNMSSLTLIATFLFCGRDFVTFKKVVGNTALQLTSIHFLPPPLCTCLMMMSSNVDVRKGPKEISISKNIPPTIVSLLCYKPIERIL